jgi:hypothetical protein
MNLRNAIATFLWCEWRRKWNIWERDGVSGRKMEYVGARWCEWRENGKFRSKMV